jgi:hypothetical protein
MTMTTTVKDVGSIRADRWWVKIEENGWHHYSKTVNKSRHITYTSNYKLY